MSKLGLNRGAGVRTSANDEDKESDGVEHVAHFGVEEIAARWSSRCGVCI